MGVDLRAPIVLGRLTEDPLAEGDFYPVDLLVAMLRIDGLFADRPAARARLREIVGGIDRHSIDYPEGTDLPVLSDPFLRRA